MKNFTEDKKGILDIITGKLISRKFLVWLAASVFLLCGVIGENTWALFSTVWLGFEGVADLFSRYFDSKGTMMVQTREHLDHPDTPPVITNQDDEVGV